MHAWHVARVAGGAQVDHRMIDRARIDELARLIVDDRAATVESWDVAPLTHRVINLTTSGLFRVHGTANVHNERRGWSVVLKVLHCPPHDESSAFNASDDPAHWNYWRREALIYASDLLHDLPPGLAVPRCYAIDEPAPDTIWLWIEEIVGRPAADWPIDRFQQATYALGQMQGALIDDDRLRTTPWLTRHWLRDWLIQPTDLHVDLLDDPAAWDHPLLAPFFTPGMADAVHRLWNHRQALLDAVGHMPRTLCHYDLWPTNLFDRGRPDGSAETVLIDWSMSGPGAIGEDIANLMHDSIWMLRLPATVLPVFAPAIVEGYLGGLRQAGFRGDDRIVRFVISAVGALRFGLFAGLLLHQAHTPDQYPIKEQRYQRPIAAILGPRAATVAHALGLSEQALALLPAITDFIAP